jgi:hypothetical protein
MHCFPHEYEIRELTISIIVRCSNREIRQDRGVALSLFYVAKSGDLSFDQQLQFCNFATNTGCPHASIPDPFKRLLTATGGIAILTPTPFVRSGLKLRLTSPLE